VKMRDEQKNYLFQFLTRNSVCSDVEILAGGVCLAVLFQFLTRNSVCSDFCWSSITILLCALFQFLTRNSVCSDKFVFPDVVYFGIDCFNSSLGILSVRTS